MVITRPYFDKIGDFSFDIISPHLDISSPLGKTIEVADSSSVYLITAVDQQRTDRDSDYKTYTCSCKAYPKEWVDTGLYPLFKFDEIDYNKLYRADTQLREEKL